MSHYKKRKRAKRRALKAEALTKRLIKSISDVCTSKHPETLSMLTGHIEHDLTEVGLRKFKWELQGNFDSYVAGIDPYNIEHSVQLGADPRVGRGELLAGEGLKQQIID